jgi:hypothetical protein
MVLEDYQPDQTIIVPRYFIFDGASIPRIAWSLIYSPFHPDVVAAALIHDYDYFVHPVGKKLADKRFLEYLIVNGANTRKSHEMYWAVRLFGGSAWDHQDPERLMKLIGMLQGDGETDLTKYHINAT